MSNNNNLCAAKAAKNDEFYTRLVDIEKEISHYKGHFKGKTVYCNCDDPQKSDFFKYFVLNFKHLGLTKLITTGFNVDQFGRGSKFVYTGIEDANSLIYGGKPICVETMKGDGSFKSEECIELLKEADIVVTNPPFSLFRDIVALLTKYNKKFMLIGSQNAIKYAEIFPMIKDNKLWLGVNPVKQFKTTLTEVEDSKKQVMEDGIVYQKFGNICWFTNLQHDKQNEKIELVQKYNPVDYPKYDDYDAIEVSRTCNIPVDYDGVMGVPISFLDKYNPNQFEILGTLSAGGKWNFAKASVDGKVLYSRILIKKKQ